MKMYSSFLLAVMVLMVSSVSGTDFQISGGNGGIHCAGCVGVTALFEEKAIMYGTSAVTELQKMCDNAKLLLKEPCLLLLNTYKKALTNVGNGVTPDEACKQSGDCDGFSQCTLFTTWPPPPYQKYVKQSSVKDMSAEKKVMDEYLADQLEKYWDTPREELGDEPGNDLWVDLLQILYFVFFGVDKDIKKVFDSHQPLVDEEHDSHGVFETFRGTSWRGKDCQDLMKHVYPGRKTQTTNAYLDHNCNGIYGIDEETGNSWESELCNVTQYGIATLGDSATAHFSFPPRYLNASEIEWDTYDDIVQRLENEMDWPECSWNSGYTDPGNCPQADDPLVTHTSIYKQMVARNLCMHRDYQNIGVNGARTGTIDATGDIRLALQRDPENDQPMLLIISLVGNDVCNGHPGMGHMTTPKEFKERFRQALYGLDGQLPAGSHVLLMPMVQGDMLYPEMHNRTHPIGCTYQEFYSYLNCLEINPCRGWLNSNTTFRLATQQRANQNSDTLYELHQELNFNGTFANFDFDVVNKGFLVTSFAGYVLEGGNLYDCIEKTDGFHPSTVGNSLWAKQVWNWLVNHHPEWLPPVNPNNKRIKEIFGDQDGY